jgi:hypothetical protein
MAFLARDFAIPEPPATAEFRLTPLRVDHLVLDYEAVMSSRERLWQLFGAGWGWPRADLSLMQDLVDLGWHQKEFQLRRSFNWAVLSPEERTLLGCCYLDPPEEESRAAGFDAEASYWVRSDRIADGLEDRVSAAFRAWIVAAWPFGRVAFPGRDQPW